MTLFDGSTIADYIFSTSERVDDTSIGVELAVRRRGGGTMLYLSELKF